MNLAQFELYIDWLSLASSAAQALLLLRFFWMRLARRYRWLMLWLVYQLVSSLVLGRLHNSLSFYTVVWSSIVILGGVLDFAVTWEIFSHRARPYGGVKVFGRGLLLLTILAGVLISSIFVSEEWHRLGWTQAKVPAIVVRAVDCAIALFLFFAGVVFRLFREKRANFNVLVIFRTLLWYFVTTGLGLLIGNLKGPHSYGWLNLWFSSVNLTTAGALLILIRKSGEARKEIPQADLQESARLDALDAQLSQLLESIKF